MKLKIYPLSYSIKTAHYTFDMLLI